MIMNMTLPADKLVQWLYVHSAPILRYRVAIDLMDVCDTEREQLRQAALATPQVQGWLDNLRQAHNIHGSKNTDAENPIAKLLEFGFDRTLPEFDQEINRLLAQPLQQWDPLVLLPLLLRAGYSDHSLVIEWFTKRIEKLYQTARGGCFDLYLDAEQASKVPKAWRGKPIYRHEVGHQAGYALPTCFDFYALAYSKHIPGINDLKTKSEAIVAYLSDPRFQSTVGGYGWDQQHHRCYAAGRVFLACVEPSRQVLFLELGAGFHAARQSEWFQHGYHALKATQTSKGTYLFPSQMLAEKTGQYIYGGSHMGLGERRVSKQGLELESTFRMLYIQKRMRDAMANPSIDAQNP